MSAQDIQFYQEALSEFREILERLRNIVDNPNIEIFVRKCQNLATIKLPPSYSFFREYFPSVRSAFPAWEDSFRSLAIASDVTRNYDWFLLEIAYRLEYIFVTDEDMADYPEPYRIFLAITLLCATLKMLVVDHDYLGAVDNIFEEAFGECQKVRHVLFEKRKQLTRPDIYGITDPAYWENEKRRFAKNLLTHTMGMPLHEQSGYTLAALLENHYIDAMLDAMEVDPESVLEVDFSVPDHDGQSNNGIDYERECISAFKEAGWVAIDTPVSGDKGADIIATKRGLKAIVQCKNWGRKINSSAIQEVVTARSFFDGDVAVVVCENGFTAQAEEIAAKLQVVVITKSDIAELETIVIKSMLRHT